MNKILIVAPSTKMGGAEQASVNLANGLQSVGKQITYISLFMQEKFFKLNSEIKFIEPENFNIKKLNLIETLLWLRKIIKKENPDAVIVYQKFYSAIVLLALAGTKYRVFISERASPLFKWSTHVSIFNKIVFSLRKPDGVIAQTSIAAEYQQKYYGKKVPIKVIPNIVREVKLFPEIKRENIILAVGRLGDHLKGFDSLIKAISITKNNWELHIAGGDEDGEYLKQMARDLNVLNRIKFLGKVKNMDEVYARAGIFVIPSRSEGFPNALLEAMAAGLPCIAFDFIAGPRDIITDGINGIIIEDGNIDALARAIDELVADPKKRLSLGKNALSVREKFHAKVITNQVLNFIQDYK
uniref:Glycosyltransferase family 4 protein n=1 Tax=Ignavibacterium album TaxID=591197 RepID=A0A832G325_9BACT